VCGRTDGCVAVVKGRRSVARVTVTALLVCHWTDTSHLTLTSAAATRARTLDTDHAPTADISLDDDDDDASQPLRCRLVELTNYFQLTILSMCITQRPWGRCLQVKYRYWRLFGLGAISYQTMITSRLLQCANTDNACGISAVLSDFALP